MHQFYWQEAQIITRWEGGCDGPVRDARDSGGQVREEFFPARKR
jgi:hypothetical protein